MPQDAYDKAELNALDREIKEQKNLTKAISEEMKPVSTLYTWTSPERDYEPKNKRWYITMAAIALFFIVLSALTANYLLIFTIIALVVVIYTVNTIPPHDATHQITNKGLYTYQTLFLWKNMIAFWVTRRNKKYSIHIEYLGKVNDPTSKDLILLVGKGDLIKIVSLIIPYVDYLGPDEISRNAIAEISKGKYVPLLDIIGNLDIHTKDPNDAPYLLREKEKNTPKF